MSRVSGDGRILVDAIQNSSKKLSIVLASKLEEIGDASTVAVVVSEANHI
jgi:hypothetical protein